jgi:hypothetical protein
MGIAIATAVPAPSTLEAAAGEPVHKTTRINNARRDKGSDRFATAAIDGAKIGRSST